MSRLKQFKDSIERLETIVENQLPGHMIADQIIFAFEYCIALSNNHETNIQMLENLCCGGLPYRDIGIFDEITIHSIYKSFGEMKKLLIEKQKMNHLMLYQPKNQPIELLKNVANILKNISEVSSAFYCVGSYLDEIITEKQIIGIEAQHKTATLLRNLTDMYHVLSIADDSLIFVFFDEEPFRNYFIKSKAFYVKDIS